MKSPESIEKYPIDPARIRHLPPRFSWLDQRLVRNAHLRQCTRSGQALYLFLAVVSDAQGLSYYSDKSIRTHLGMEQRELELARRDLITHSLMVFERPLYQLLSLDPCKIPEEGYRERTSGFRSVAEILGLNNPPQR